MGTEGAALNCQNCRSDTLLVFSAGFLPASNDFRRIDEPARPVTKYPTDLYFCERCGLCQLGYVPPAEETFPASYPYTSSTTRALRENFAQLAEEVGELFALHQDGLVIDIGGNDGNLLSNFVGRCRTLNVTPEDMGARGVERGIPHLQRYWSEDTARMVVAESGRAQLITATNVFAHVPDLHEFLRGVDAALDDGGLFILENHYLPDLLKTLQFDTIYTEHARYLSLTAIRNQVQAHGLDVVFARRINSHGGSIRVYAMRPGADADGLALAAATKFPARRIQEDEVTLGDFAEFGTSVELARVELRACICDIKALGFSVWAVGAPSRATTLVNFYGLNELDIDCILEAPGSAKIGKCLPGTRIPVVDERAHSNWPAFLLILSHHIAPEMMNAMRNLGFTGQFIIPLPEVRIE